MPARSKSQQKLFAMALAYKRGEMPDASDKVKKLADSMSEKELRKYAKTSGLRKEAGGEKHYISQTESEDSSGISRRTQRQLGVFNARVKRYLATEPGSKDALIALDNLERASNRIKNAKPEPGSVNELSDKTLANAMFRNLIDAKKASESGDNERAIRDYNLYREIKDKLITRMGEDSMKKNIKNEGRRKASGIELSDELKEKIFGTSKTNRNTSRSGGPKKGTVADLVGGGRVGDLAGQTNELKFSTYISAADKRGKEASDAIRRGDMAKALEADVKANDLYAHAYSRQNAGHNTNDQQNAGHNTRRTNKIKRDRLREMVKESLAEMFNENNKKSNDPASDLVKNLPSGSIVYGKGSSVLYKGPDGKIGKIYGPNARNSAEKHAQGFIKYPNISENCANLIAPFEDVVKNFDSWEEKVMDVVEEIAASDSLSEAEKKALSKGLVEEFEKARSATSKLAKIVKYIAKKEGEIENA